VKELAKGNASKAAELAKQAIATEPREARFQELLGDVAMSQNNSKEALSYYERALKMQPDYFRPHLQTAIALKNLGRNAEAEEHLKHSNELLPTAPGFYLLGQLAEERGDTNTALKNYEIAAGSDSDVGKSSMARLTHLDMPRNPAKYLQAEVRSDGNGNLYAVVQNPTDTTVTKVRIRIVHFDPASGQPDSQTQPLLIASDIGPNQREQLKLEGVRISTPEEVNLYRVSIESAELVR
jgi:tetratricopeptide (TPR) repeat protein